MKFKVGDEIRGVKGSPYGFTNEDMTRGRVEQTNSDGDIRVRILGHAKKAKVGQSFDVDSKYFELIAPPESIHITRDGDTVHAIHKRNGEIVKRTKAVCDTRDEFDFGAGASIAFGRVLGVDTHYVLPDKPAPEPIKFNFDDFKAGKFAVNCPTEHEADIFLAYLHGRGVRWQCTHTPLIAKNNWRTYCENTTYRCGESEIGFAPSDFYQREEHIPVIPFCKDDL